MDNKTNQLRTILIAAISVVLLLVGISKARSVWRWGSSDPGEWVSVLVADRYIPAFSVIKAEMIRAQEYPKNLVPPGALLSRNELENENKQMLFTSAISIPEGHPVTRALLTDASQNDTLGSVIQPGKVAVSFEIDKAHGVGGWIRPGDTVALFGASPMSITSARGSGKKTRLLLPSVLVVAVDDKRLGQNQDKSGENGTDPSVTPEAVMSGGAKIITVLVTPSAASALIEAREEGSISVVLRSLGDDVSWPTTN
jgi:pilus assembly protein CpaB